MNDVKRRDPFQPPKKIKRLTDAFSYIFSDNEWFNKVLIGGFYFLLIPFGIGLIMMNGYLLEFMIRQRSDEKDLPKWRDFATVFIIGLRRSWISLGVIVYIYYTVFVTDYTFTIPQAISTLLFFLTLNSMIVANKVDTFSFLASLLIVFIAISVGWMWIVVGWPLLIFLALLVQVYLFANAITKY